MPALSATLVAQNDLPGPAAPIGHPFPTVPSEGRDALVVTRRRFALPPSSDSGTGVTTVGGAGARRRRTVFVVARLTALESTCPSAPGWILQRSMHASSLRPVNANRKPECVKATVVNEPMDELGRKPDVARAASSTVSHWLAGHRAENTDDEQGKHLSP
jgi:hypothetical protein